MKYIGEDQEALKRFQQKLENNQEDSITEEEHIARCIELRKIDKYPLSFTDAESYISDNDLHDVLNIGGHCDTNNIKLEMLTSDCKKKVEKIVSRINLISNLSKLYDILDEETTCKILLQKSKGLFTQTEQYKCELFDKEFNGFHLDIDSIIIYIYIYFNIRFNIWKNTI